MHTLEPRGCLDPTSNPSLFFHIAVAILFAPPHIFFTSLLPLSFLDRYELKGESTVVLLLSFAK